MLNLDDFSRLFVSGVNVAKDDDRRTIEEIYQKKLEELEKFYKERLEEERKRAFKEGYESGKNETKKVFEKILTEEKNRYEQSLKKEKELLTQQLAQLSFVLREENVKIGRKVIETICEYLEEIFDFLFIQDVNLVYLKGKLKEVIDDLKVESKPISVEVSEKFAEILKDVEDFSVKVNREMKDGDFVVKFTDFTVVHSLKEKLTLLREEIEREIKKSS